ncbi:MAG: hypothetical protein M1823_001184 [Watsoniomyces obsoletus]|nr:MAG: hypothetical protein M1823_001184 [Watsoniomyces obsoletus]
MRLQSLLLLVLGASMGLASPIASPDSPKNPRKIWSDQQSEGGDRQIIQPGATYGNAQEQSPRRGLRQVRPKMNVLQHSIPAVYDWDCSKCETSPQCNPLSDGPCEFRPQSEPPPCCTQVIRKSQ